MWSKLAVWPAGAYVPCGMLSHITPGRINEDRLEEVWCNHRELIKLRERYKIPLSTFAECTECSNGGSATSVCGLGGTITGGS